MTRTATKSILLTQVLHPPNDCDPSHDYGDGDAVGATVEW